MGLSIQKIEEALSRSGVTGFTGKFNELGGGEVNDTYLLDCGELRYVLRVAKKAGRNTLLKESQALRLFQHPNIPKLVYFNEEESIDGHLWVIESYVHGSVKPRLNNEEFYDLGKLLAAVHRVKDPKNTSLHLWNQFLTSCRSFGSEHDLLHHKDPRLNRLINRMHEIMTQVQPEYTHIDTVLVHGDATPSNILVDNGAVHLIDWEFASFSDPMKEFSSIYYDDMEYNKGKWRIKISQQEKDSLFSGYRDTGGELHEDRITFWMNNDKLGAAVYLYWKLYVSGDSVDALTAEQNRHDLSCLLDSLEGNL